MSLPGHAYETLRIRRAGCRERPFAHRPAPNESGGALQGWSQEVEA
jgi:hypothetical protein